MTRPLSLLLDLIRLGAALLVFFHHAAIRKFASGLPYRFTQTGQEPVIVFFLLSGFVIAYCADAKDRSPKIYALNRLSRLYSVVVPALLLTALLNPLGSWLAPDLYQDHWTDPATLANVGRPLFEQMLATGMFLNEIWGWDIWPGVNSPFWSLGYEAFYYLLYALVVWGGRYRWYWAGLVAAIAGPKILLLLPLWGLGVATYKLVAASRVQRGSGYLLVGTALVGYILFLATGVKSAIDQAIAVSLGADTTRWLSNSSEFLSTYVTGILFAALLVGLAAIAEDFAGPLYRFQRPIRFLAGLTFALYLFHYPLVYFLRAVVLATHLEGLSSVIVTGGTLAAVVLLGQVTEAQKDNWRQFLARLVTRTRPAEE